eukprot:TRINITY_DN8545_c0_g1_i1.p1 TRINITY_DN8545_c0_g1~~TRINITY_DN8545_c0_g1_i1.p1  ORF type:complete len:329 (-),score=79.32 TRINITY_DN8545_c0_g1_i1:58-1044(-)
MIDPHNQGTYPPSYQGYPPTSQGYPPNSQGYPPAYPDSYHAAMPAPDQPPLSASYSYPYPQTETPSYPAPDSTQSPVPTHTSALPASFMLQVKPNKPPSQVYSESVKIDAAVTVLVVLAVLVKIVEIIIPIDTLAMELCLVLFFVLLVDVLIRMFAGSFVRFLTRPGDVVDAVVTIAAVVGQFFVFMDKIKPFSYYGAAPVEPVEGEEVEAGLVATTADLFYTAFVHICHLFAFLIILRLWRAIRVYHYITLRNLQVKDAENGSAPRDIESLIPTANQIFKTYFKINPFAGAKSGVDSQESLPVAQPAKAREVSDIIARYGSKNPYNK